MIPQERNSQTIPTEEPPKFALQRSVSRKGSRKGSRKASKERTSVCEQKETKVEDKSDNPHGAGEALKGNRIFQGPIFKIAHNSKYTQYGG